MFQPELRPDLPEVTVCAVDSVNVALAARALHCSQSVCRFADAVLCAPTRPDGAFRWVQTPPLAGPDGYGAYVLRELHRHIRTRFVLIVQWDGYVINPECWSADFLRYDYIGARWPWHTDGRAVGNGGFSLRSRRLLEVLSLPRFAGTLDRAEDDFICRLHRPTLEQEYGLVFAPEEVADRFSYESQPPAQPTFGFHGLFNLWRHVDDRELAEMVPHFAFYVAHSREYCDLMMVYFHLRKFRPLFALFSRLAAFGDTATCRAIMLQGFDTASVDACLAICQAGMAATASPAAAL